MVQFLTGLQVSTVISDLNTVISERRKAGPESADGQTVRESKISISTEDSASVLIDFEGKAKGCLMLSQVAAGHKNRLAFEINGTRASAAWNSERPNELWIGYRDRPNELMISETSLLSPQAKAICGPGHTKGILDVWYQFLNAVYREIRRSEIFNRDEASFATFVDGHRDIKILEAIIASHQARGWLAVDQ
jgi:predicted dehydrogenase